ncbi:N-acetylmuramoyl-L-alanine amidase [Prochlorococcus sp. MIT 0601]|uniref:N-acetylmuramoyl-L-alanine amidase n=1 Tax=Prochlorococcus sp. MIT 0601 TaxID=1499498 RepID=UPI000AA6FC7F
MFSSVVAVSNLVFPLSSEAASSLAAWLIRSNGVLEFRTARDTKLKAFYQSSSDGKGDRVWIDFPGELIRPRTLPGNGPIKEIRLGKPKDGFTRFVIEFNPYVDINPYKLILKGTAPDRWELDFITLPARGLKQIGEGNISKALPKSSRYSSLKPFKNLKLSALPNVTKNRFLVVIDPGHGGPDSGAIGIGGLRESEIVLDVSKQVVDILYKKGVKAKLTRNSEIDLDLPPRVNMANRIGADVFVSIHANASRGFQKDVNGLETYYFSGYQGFKLAKNIQNEILKADPKSPDRGVRQGRFFVIRRTNMPAALVEIGFLTGIDDARSLSQADHLKRVAFAISKGILKYLKEAY